MDIAQRVKVNLEARGYAVVQTRLDDGYIAQRTRLDIAIAKGQRSSSRSISTAIPIQALTGLKSGFAQLSNVTQESAFRDPAYLQQVADAISAATGANQFDYPWGIAVR